MRILRMGQASRAASAALGAALFLAGAPGYGGDRVTGNGYGARDAYYIVNLVPGMGYRSRINTRGLAAFEYVSFANRLRVGFFNGERVSDISPPGSDASALGDMNEKGEVAQYGLLPVNDGLERVPFRWCPAAGWTRLPVLGTSDTTYPGTINDRGVIAGVSYVGDGYRAVRWSATNDLLRLQTPPGFGESYAGEINEHGVNVGSATDPAGAFHAFVWDTAGVPTDLGTFGATAAVALLNNKRGDVAGWLDLYAPDFQSFLWSPGQGVTRVGLHALPGEMNNVGELVGRIYDPDTSTNHAYVFSRARGLVDLHRAPFTSSEAIDVDDKGTVVGEMSSDIPGAVTRRAYRWSRSGEAVDLNTRLVDPPDGLVVTQAIRISPRGDIIANSNAGMVLLRRSGGTDAPVLGPIQMPDIVRPAEPVTLTVSFRDRNEGDVHSATVDWGDGGGPQPAAISELGGRGTLSASHTYARRGGYDIVVRVTDATGRTTVQTRYLRIFQLLCAPGIAGEGALPAVAERATQATLVFRLEAPLDSACGDTRPFTFVLQGRVAFKGERLERVSRNGNTVHLEGSGTLDGRPGYRFSIDATDGQHGGASGTDRLAVRIEHIDPAGTGIRPAVLNYGVADSKLAPVRAASEGILPPTALRLIE